MRSTARANNAMLRIATLIVALEVLVRDIDRWGTRFPEAKRRAEKLLGAYPARPRIWLMDKYM